MPTDSFLAPLPDLLRVAVVGGLAYVGLVVLLRITGKRTLTKLNAFDLVVTVALGSTLATVLLDADTALLEGLVAFATLILLQYAVTWASMRSPRFQNLVKASPSLLVYRGRVLDHALRAERVSREEILAVARSSGATDLAEIGAVVMETDGSLSILMQAPQDAAEDSTLATVVRDR